LSWLSWLVPFVQHKHPCPRRDSNPQSQSASDQRPTPQTARPMGSVVTAVGTGYYPAVCRQTEVMLSDR
jgi:hypothetical protein